MKIVRPIPISDAVFTSSSLSEGDYMPWDLTTAYSAGNRVVYASTHEVYEAIDGNTGADPTTAGTTHWVLVGATNKWRMFDGSIGQQSSAWSNLAVTLTNPERFDTIALFNIAAATVTINVTTPIDGTVWDVPYSLVEPVGIRDWWNYFYQPVRFRSDFYLGGMPPFTDATVTVTLTNMGTTVACGELILGLSREIGLTQYGASVGIQDYSIKQVDDYGNYTVLERAFARRADFTVWADNGSISDIASLLSLYRATPIIYVGATETEYTATIVYGFYRDWTVEVTYPSYCICSLQVDGLT